MHTHAGLKMLVVLLLDLMLLIDGKHLKVVIKMKEEEDKKTINYVRLIYYFN